MKPIAVFVLVAAFFIAPIAAMAKNTTTTGSTDTQVTNTLAGPPEASNNRSDTHKPTKAELKKAKVKPKPAMQDPN